MCVKKGFLQPVDQDLIFSYSFSFAFLFSIVTVEKRTLRKVPSREELRTLLIVS